MLLTISLAALAALSLLLLLWQVAVAWRFPLHRHSAHGSFAPSVTLLKPLKGCDAETAACLASWLTQDYAGPVQVLFGVASADDPVCAVVRGLLAAHPQCNAQLVVCPERLGPNAKVSTLIQLGRLVRHEVVVVSDADVRVPNHLLAQLVAPLHEPQAGLVNCFYQLANPANFAMRWEAFAVNADFWSQVLQSRSLKPLDFALGAVMATTRGWLERIGGFASLADYLADDYQLGRLVARQEGRIELCPIVAECWTAPMNFREVWAHQLRWARTIRMCQPVPVFFSILSNATLWPLIWAVVQPSAVAAVGAGFCFLLRGAAGFVLQRRLTRRANVNSIWLAWIKDLLGAVIWALSFTGSVVSWRGERFRVRAGGRLVRLG